MITAEETEGGAEKVKVTPRRPSADSSPSSRLGKFIRTTDACIPNR
jgi:hypothetical protein